MIAIVEPFCVGLEHVAVNAAIIDTVCRAYPGEQVQISAEAQHLGELRTALGAQHAERTHWHAIHVPPRFGSFAARIVPEMRLLRAACTFGERTAGLCVLLSVHRSTLWVAKALSKAGVLHTPIQAILHGGLSEAAGWRSRNPLIRMWDMRSTLVHCAGPHLQYIVLEHSISLALQQRLPELAQHLGCIPHPIPAAEICNAPVQVAGSPIRIGFVGLASEAKGFPVFMRLATQVRAAWSDRVEFHALGMLPIGAEPDSAAALQTAPARTQLPRAEFLERLRALHYVCLPYQSQHYELTASGALLDAIAQTKPIIALATPTLRTLFQAQPHIGYLCESQQELFDLVPRLVGQFPADEYQRQVETLAALRTTRLPEALATSYLATTTSFLAMTKASAALASSQLVE